MLIVNKTTNANSMSMIHVFSWSLRLIIPMLLPFLHLFALEIPLEFSGRGSLGKYLNSDTVCFSMDASIDFYCTLLRYKDLSLFVRYRDDLDMAEQKGGVSLDPRYAHYYIVGGIDYVTTPFLFSGYFMHDCIHDIDYEIEGTPVFNRIRIQFADAAIHRSKRLVTSKRFLWSAELGFYPGWYYHGWIINYGADYNYDVILKSVVTVFRIKNIGVDVMPTFQIAKGDTCLYHQHVVQFNTYYRNNSRRIGLGLDYNLWNNDPIKSPDKLWLLSLFLEF